MTPITRQLSTTFFTPAVTFTFLIGCAVSGVGGFLLNEDLRRGGSASNLPEFAKILQSHSQIRRRPHARFEWENANQGEHVRVRDSIHTGIRGTTTLQLKDTGDTIELGPDTLVVLDKTEKLPLQFLSGSAIVRKQTGADEKITVAQDGTAKVEVLPVKLLKPVPGFVHWTQSPEDTRISFAWSAVSENRAAQTFEVYDSQSGKKVHQTRLGPAVTAYAVSLSPGSYRWQVRPVGATAASELRELAVGEAAPSMITTPLVGRPLETRGERGSIRFTFKSMGRSALGQTPGIDLEIADNPDFKTPIQTLHGDASSPYLSAESIPIGTWYARILTRYGETVQVNGPTLAFELRRIEKLPIVWLSPPSGESFNQDRELTFSWRLPTRLPEGTETKVQVLSAQAPEQILREVKVVGERWSLVSPPKGEFKIRVTTTTEGIESGASDWLSFSIFEGTPITLTDPPDEFAQEFREKARPFALQWRKDRTVEENPSYQYRVEVQAQTNEVIAAEKHADARVRMTRDHEIRSEELGAFEEGTYRWKVSAVNPQGKVLKASSERTFTLRRPPLLPALARSELVPKYNEVLDTIARAGVFELRWPKQDGARAYRLKVISLTNEGKVLFDGDIDENTHRFEALREGTYSWSLRAIDSLGRAGGALEGQLFKVTYGDVLPAPRTQDRVIGTATETAALRAPASAPLSAPRSRTPEVQ